MSQAQQPSNERERAAPLISDLFSGLMKLFSFGTTVFVELTLLQRRIQDFPDVSAIPRWGALAKNCDNK